MSDRFSRMRRRFLEKGFKMDLTEAIQALKEERKIFHSEADLQFSLAWKIKQQDPMVDIRLEYCPAFAPNMHIDIVVFDNGNAYPIELKYKTSAVDMVIGEERYSLKNHGAQDLGRYDYVYDISRIEFLKERWSLFQKGYAIMLSNDPSYWVAKKGDRETVCDDFRIHSGIHKSGRLSWLSNASAGTIKGREAPIVLSGEYDFAWDPFSTIGNGRNGEFKISVIEIA